MILKVIGIILLSIIGVLVIALLLILLCPISYSIDAKFTDKILTCLARASWLGILKVKFEYKDESKLSVKILFWDLTQKEDNKKRKQKNNKQKATNKTEAYKDKINVSDISSSVEPVQDHSKANSFNNLKKWIWKSWWHLKKENTYEDSQHIEASEGLKFKSISSETLDKFSQKDNTPEIKTETRFETESISKTKVESDTEIKNNSNIKDKDTNNNKTKSNKNKPIYDKIKNIINIIRSEEFKNTFPIIKRKFIRLLKIILPKKWNIEATVGFEDPSKTGNILIYTSLLYPFFQKPIRVYLDKKIKKLLSNFKEAYNGW